MGTILIASEYARSHKKIKKLAQVANTAINEGHVVHVITGTLNHGDTTIEDTLRSQTDAKVHTGFRHEFGGYSGSTPTSFSELLLNSGFNNQKRTAMNLRKAVDLIRKVKPTHLLCWESPTFMLAAKLTSVDVKAINIGDHRFIAPNVTPIPPFAVTDKATGYTDLVDQVLLRQVQHAVKTHFHVPIHGLDIFFTEQDLVEGWQEFDPFNRDQERFVGMVNPYQSFPPMMWEDAAPKRILLHIDHDKTSCGTAILTAARDIDADKIAYVRGGSLATQTMSSKYNRAGFRLTSQAINFDNLLTDCDVLVTTYDRDLLMAAAQKGVPVIVFPSNVCEATICNHTAASQWLEVIEGDPGMWAIRERIQQKMDCTDSLKRLQPFQQRTSQEAIGRAELRILRHLTSAT